MKKIFMLGPMPPAIGGMATVLDNLSKSSLVNETTMHFWDTAKQTSENRSLFSAISYRISAWKKFYKALNSEQPDFVHIHTCSGFTTFFLDACFALMAKFKGIPYIIHIHGATFDKFLSTLPKTKLKFVMYVLQNAKCIVALSKEWQDIFQDQWQLNNVSVIANGVPNPAFERALNFNTKHILFMGQVCTRKGTKDLVKAFAKADTDAVLHLAGDFGGDVSRADLEQFISEHPNVMQNIVVEGPVMGEKKRALMELCDIFCLPSYAEGLPMVVLEAMSYKQAVLTTKVGGLPGLITHNENGMLCAAGDIEAISDGLKGLVAQVDNTHKIAINGYNTFASQYSTDAIVKYYTALYNAPL